MGTITRDFTQLVANGSSDPQNVPINGDYLFFASGTWGAGTLTLEASPDNGTTWFSVTSLTANGRTKVFLGSGENVRVTLSGATAATIDAGLR